MDRVIKRISEIESGSVKIMDDANAQKSYIFTQIKEQTNVFDQKLEAETHTRIQELKERLEKDMYEKLNHQKEAADRFLASLEQHYAENHENYVVRLFQDMTGV